MSIDNLMGAQAPGAGTTTLAAETPTVFEQGLGLFSHPEDAELMDQVVSLVYAERRRSTKDQPVAF